MKLSKIIYGSILVVVCDNLAEYYLVIENIRNNRLLINNRSYYQRNNIGTLSAWFMRDSPLGYLREIECPAHPSDISYHTTAKELIADNPPFELKEGDDVLYKINGNRMAFKLKVAKLTYLRPGYINKITAENELMTVCDNYEAFTFLTK